MIPSMKISSIRYSAWRKIHVPTAQACLGNKELTVGRLRSVTRKLERMQRFEEYHTVMDQQLNEGII